MLRNVGRPFTAAIVAWLMLGTPLAGAFGCGGWKPAAEARMACCAKSAACPMRAHRAAPSPAAHVSQAEADACCAAAETDEAPPLVAFALPALVAVLPALPAVVLSPPAVRTYPPEVSPPPRPAIARHLLLTVILI